jgi:hypothetical protein
VSHGFGPRSAIGRVAGETRPGGEVVEAALADTWRCRTWGWRVTEWRPSNENSARLVPGKLVIRRTRSGGLMNTAQRVIAKFGGQTALAHILGKPQSTIQYWSKAGAIPAKWHKPILAAAIERGLSLGPADIVAIGDTESQGPIRPPEAKWPGTLDCAGIEIPCYVLDDGRHVISRTGALHYLTEGRGGGNIESYLRVEKLRSFLPTDLADQFIEISIPQVVNKDVKALSASAFIDICRAYARARDTGALESESQVQIAIRASMALAAFAKTGIEAAIDEATGYQYERAEDALRVKLKLFLEEEMRPWEKTFPDELWVQFGRLTRWRGPIHQRPKYWGKLVNELVYSYLDPDVYEWLRTHAPAPRHGQNYHQWLSGQYGLRKLIEHVWMLIGMATVCHEMRELRQRMAEKFGRQSIQFTLFLPPAARADRPD